MNHWKPNMNHMNDDMSFIVDMLMSVMSHPCDCPGCTMQKGRAVNALTWLIGDKLEIAEAKQRAPFNFDRAMRDYEDQFGDDYEEVPEEVVLLCQRAVEDGHLEPDKRAIIAGWLESLST